MVICAGCRVIYPGRRHYAAHVERAANPACKEAYYGPRVPRRRRRDQKKDQRGVQMDVDDESSEEREEGGQNDPNPVPFQGDFFGAPEDYAMDDLPGWGDDRDQEEQQTDAAEHEPTRQGAADESDEDGDEASVVADAEAHRPVWEPERHDNRRNTQPGTAAALDSTDDNEASPEPTTATSPAVNSTLQERMESALRSKVHITEFPLTSAGAPIDAPSRNSGPSGYNGYEDNLGTGSENEQTNIYAPFAHRVDWEFARWAKLRGSSSTAVTELLSIDGVVEKLGLSCKTSAEINALVDSLPAARPRFQRHEVVVGGEVFDVFFRDVMQCIRALYSEPEFARHLIYAPERHYSDADKTQRVFHDMHTGKWWWTVQSQVEEDTPGATIVPVIVSSDKTQLTLFRNKAAYPVYLTIGNLPKDIRSRPSQGGHILLGYLPTSKLEHITNKALRRRTQADLFHECMRSILQPLEQAGLEGVPMTSGDGQTRRCHPIYAAYVGDYPEQVLVACVKTGDCVACPRKRDKLGDLGSGPPSALRDLGAVLDVLDCADEMSDAEYNRACKRVGIRPVCEPFWHHLPYSDVFSSFAPDILHQLHQGVVKHLFSWVKAAYSEDEINARCRRFPPNHNVRLFFKGVTSLSRLTGREHADISRILLGLIIDMRLPDNASPARLVRAVRALLDFSYLAQYPVHSQQSLDALEDALQRFHDNKQIFIDLGIRLHFNFPKMHCLEHYRYLIELLGTTDNFNTEYTERLHIDLAKEAYRASNRKDEYTQMTLWLERKEKVLRHDRYIKWVEAGRPPLGDINDLHKHATSHVFMTREPSAKGVPFWALERDYGAAYFKHCLARFTVTLAHPTLSRTLIEDMSARYRFDFHKVQVYHKAKFWEQDFPRYRHASDEYDVVHATPPRHDARGNYVPGRYDLALVNDGTGGSVGVKGYRLGRVRAIFTIPERHTAAVFPNGTPPSYLAYVEWFTPFSQAPESLHGLYKVKKSMRNGYRQADVIPLQNIRRSAHVYPSFGHVVPSEWTSANVLDLCDTFFVNSFTDRHTYGTVV